MKQEFYFKNAKWLGAKERDADTFSILPWPYGCLSSAGFDDAFTDIKATNDATKSTDECIASDIILTEPLKIPATIFSIISVELDIIDKSATLTFLSSSFIMYLL